MTEQDYGGTDDPIDDRSDDGSRPPLPDPAKLQAAISNARRADLTQMMNELPAEHPGRKVIAEVLAAVNPAEDARTLEWAYGTMRAWAQEWIQTNILDAVSPEIPATLRVKLKARAAAMEARADSYQQASQYMCGVEAAALNTPGADENYYNLLMAMREDPQQRKDHFGTYEEYLAARNLAQEKTKAARQRLVDKLVACTTEAQAGLAKKAKEEEDAEFKARMAKEESLKWHNVIKAKVKDFFYQAVNFVKKALDSGGRGDTTNDGLSTAPAPAPAAPPPTGRVSSGNVLTLISDTRAIDQATGVYYVLVDGRWVREDQQPSTRR